MTKYKNTIMVLVAFILFAYAAFISVVPKVYTNNFNIEKFEQDMQKATSLITDLGSIDVKIASNLKTTITLKNLSFKYIDKQDIFEAKDIEIETTPAALFAHSYKINALKIKNAKYVDQLLKDGKNKLTFLPQAIDTTAFGTKSITIIPNGNVSIKKMKVSYVTPTTYREKNIREKEYTKAEVKDFLSSLEYSHVVIK